MNLAQKTRVVRDGKGRFRDRLDNAATPLRVSERSIAVGIKSQALNVQSLPMWLQTIRRIQSPPVNY